MEQTIDGKKSPEAKIDTEGISIFLQALLDLSGDTAAVLDSEKRPLFAGKGVIVNQNLLANTESVPVPDKEGNLLGFILRKKNRTFVERDFLTGVVSRSCLEKEFAERNLNRAVQAELTLVFIDLNRFKPVNELYGHLVGDQVLLQFATLLKNSFRKSDCVARYGGDEFVILSSCAENIVKKRISDFQARLANQYIEVTLHGHKTETERISLGFCYGLTSVHPEDRFSTALERADMKLLAMKEEYRC